MLLQRLPVPQALTAVSSRDSATTEGLLEVLATGDGPRCDAARVGLRVWSCVSLTPVLETPSASGQPLTQSPLELKTAGPAPAWGWQSLEEAEERRKLFEMFSGCGSRRWAWDCQPPHEEGGPAAKLTRSRRSVAGCSPWLAGLVLA